MCARSIWTRCFRRKLLSQPWRKLWERRLTKQIPKPVALLCFAVLLISCGKRGADEEKGEAAIPEVTVTKLKRAPISQELIVTGNLAALPNRDAKVAALIPGRVM